MDDKPDELALHNMWKGFVESLTDLELVYVQHEVRKHPELAELHNLILVELEKRNAAKSSDRL